MYKRQARKTIIFAMLFFWVSKLQKLSEPTKYLRDKYNNTRTLLSNNPI